LGSPSKPAGYVESVFSKAGDRILVNHGEDTARLYDLTGKELAAYRSEGRLWHVAFDPSGKRVVTGGADGTARVFTLDGEPLTVFRTEGQVLRAYVLPPGDRLFVESMNPWIVHIVKLDGTVLHELGGGGNLSPRGDHFLRSPGDGSLELYDTEAKKITRLCEPGTLPRLHRVKWSPQGDRLLVMLRSETRAARVWDLEGNELAVLRGHEAPLVWMVGRFSPSGDRVLTYSWDETARVWDLQGNTITVLRGHTGVLSDASLSPSGDEIVTVAEDNTVRTWHAKPEDLRDLADRRKPREFTAAERLRYAELLEPVER
jgi:WD40 repeat protein